ncbi:MAG TPA: Calx-beta domain-containing protein [Pyrinomonadaceae bacterium]
MYFRLTSRFPLTVVVCLAVVLAALLPVTSYWLRTISSAEAAPFFVDQTFVRKVDLPANDLVVDPNTQTIYASVPSTVVNNGNKLVPINPTTGALGTGVFVGSEPNKLAITDNGQVIYVALNGSGSVRRFDVPSQTAGQQIPLGTISNSPLLARAIAVQPGSTGTIAIQRSMSDLSNGGVAIFDNTVQRSAVANTFSTLSLAFNTSDPSKLYGLDVQSLFRFAVAAGGVSNIAQSGVKTNGVAKFSGGKLYSSDGKIFNPDTGDSLGTFTSLSFDTTNAFVIDSNVNRAYFITGSFSLSSPQTATLRVFDTQTFATLGTFDIPNVVGTPNEMVRWGSNGLAFSTNASGVYLIQTTFIPSPDPVPTPTPTPSGTPTPTPTPPVETGFIRTVSLKASDIIYDPVSNKIYASQPSSAGPNGNSLIPITPTTATLGTPVFVGSEPTRLARSSDGQFIYVALNGAAAVRRFKVATQQAELQFSLGFGDFNTGPLFVDDIEAVPGEPNAVAVSRRNSGFSPRHEGVAIYDNGVRRPNTTPNHTGSNVIEFGSTGSALYGANNETTEFGFQKMSVNSLGVTVTQVTGNVFPGFDTDFKVDNGRAYSNGGLVVDPETATSLGRFVLNSSGNLVVPDSSVGRTFFISGADQSDSTINSTIVIRAFDQNTFVPVGSLNLSGVNGRVGSAVRWGSNGLAICTSGGQLFLIQSNLITQTVPAPTPTPTPFPSPTPTPTPVPTPNAGDLRQISFTTNDLVVDPVSQNLFVSVPSSAGANGNSVVPIDPTSGTLGASVFVGSEPNRLAVSDTGLVLYVGIDGANAVRKFDILNRTAGIQFSLGSDPFSAVPYRAQDMAVAPGQPDVLAVARLRPGVSPAHGGVAIFDNGVRRALTTPNNTSSNVIEFSRSPEILYGQNTDSTEFGFRRMVVGPCGVLILSTVESLISGFNIDVKVDNGVAYSTGGRTIDPEAGNLLGTFVIGGPNSFISDSVVAPDAKARKVYYLVNDNGQTLLRVYDSKTFVKLGDLALPGVPRGFSSLVRWGTNGLAFRTPTQVYLLQNALIGGQDPNFVSAPAPTSPTVSASIHISSSNGDPSGVTLNATGSLTTTATTDSSGNAMVSGITQCGSVTITPTKPNYVFSPASQTIDNPTSSTSLNFTATLKTIGFQSSAASATESNGKASITVTRNISTDPATVAFETSPGTASDRSDFNAAFGTLLFAAGEATKQITILLTDDVLIEGAEQFTVTLKNPTGGELSTSTITVTIFDNDSQANAPNPLSIANFFVRQHYQDFLNRAAVDDPSGLAFWTNEISSCNSVQDPTERAACFEAKHLHVSAAFFLSIEFQQTGYLVHRFYVASYLPSASRPRGLPRMKEFLTDTQEIQKGVIVGQSGWEQKLEQNKQAFALAWVNRASFIAEHPLNQTADQFVDSLFQTSSVTPTAAERSAAITAFGAGGASGRAASLRSIAESQSVFDKHYNAAFVLMQYFGYLRRNPDDAPDGNFDGYQFWLDKLNQFNGNFLQAEMVKAFLVSAEYQQRFGPANFVLQQ